MTSFILLLASLAQSLVLDFIFWIIMSNKAWLLFSGSLFALCATMQALMGVVGTFTFQVLYVYMNSKNRSSQVYFFIALTCVVPLLLFM